MAMQSYHISVTTWITLALSNKNTLLKIEILIQPKGKQLHQSLQRYDINGQSVGERHKMMSLQLGAYCFPGEIMLTE